MRASLFELSKDIPQFIRWPDNVDTSTKDLNKTSNRGFIFGVNEDEILDEQQSNDIVFGAEAGEMDRKIK